MPPYPTRRPLTGQLLLYTLLVLLLASCRPILAQPSTTLARLAVHVSDPTGAVLPGATISLHPAAAGAAPSASEPRPAGRPPPSSPREHTASASNTPASPLRRPPSSSPPATSENYTSSLALPAHDETVEARTERYAAEEASTATRLPLRLQETPQQIDVLTPELLRSRGVESMKQAIEMVPAAGLQLGEGRRDNFFLRGFNAVGDMYLDGVRDDAQYYRDLSNTERIEVLEGPAAVLYGRGSSGGLINRVTKKPQMEGTLGQLSYTAGSYGEQRGTADLDTLVPGTHRTLGFRLTGAAEHEGSHRHLYWMDRYTFAPTLLWNPDANTDIRIAGERLRDDRLPDRGIPYLPSTGLPAPVPVGNFYGYVGSGPGSNFIHSAVTNGSLEATHRFADGWSVHATGRAAGYATNFANMYATAITPGANDAPVFCAESTTARRTGASPSATKRPLAPAAGWACSTPFCSAPNRGLRPPTPPSTTALRIKPRSTCCTRNPSLRCSAPC